MFVHFREECSQLVNEMSREIGKINIYDIYQPCFINMGTSATRARYIYVTLMYTLLCHTCKSLTVYRRNPVKDLLLQKVGQYTGPDGCIDDHVERKYFDNEEVSSCRKSNSYQVLFEV